MPSPDAQLLRDYAREGSEAAFAELVQRHIALVYSTALRQLAGDTHLAQDITQAVFTLLARKAGTLLGREALAGWLYLAANNLALQAVRAERRRRVREQEAQMMQEITSPPTPANSWERVRPVLDEALRELRDGDREAVLLRFFENRPFAEIGAMLRLSEDAARMRVERALDKLHALLARRGITSTAAALGAMLASEAGAASVPAALTASVTGTALASAGATVGTVVPLAGILGFMSTTKMVLGIAGVIALAGVGMAVFERAEAHRAENEVMALRTARDAAQEKLARSDAQLREATASEARIAAREKQREAARGGRSGSREAGVVSASAGNSSAADPNPGMDPTMGNPEYVRLFVEKYRADLSLKYGPLYEALKLTPEQIAKFQANRIEFQRVTMEVWSSAVAKSVPIGSVASLVAEQAKTLDMELNSLLGEAGFKEYVQYQRNDTAREVAGSLAGYLYRSDAPLTRQQGEQVAQFVADNTRRVQAGPNKVWRYETDWDAVLAQSAAVLTSPQAATFQALAARRKFEKEMAALSAPTTRVLLTNPTTK